MSAMAGPDMAVAAAEAAVAVICNETSCPKEIFNCQDLFTGNASCALTVDNKPERYDPWLPNLHRVIDYPALYFMILNTHRNNLSVSIASGSTVRESGKKNGLSQAGYDLSLQFYVSLDIDMGT